MTVRFLPRARDEFDAQLATLKQLDVGAARRMLHDVADALAKLEARPALGSQHTLKRSGRPVRRWFVAPLWLYYEPRAHGIVIVRVRHHAQRPITR